MPTTGGVLDVTVSNDRGTADYKISNGTEPTYSGQTLMGETILSEQGSEGIAITARASFIACDLLLDDADNGEHLKQSSFGAPGRVTMRLRDGRALALNDAYVVGEVDFNARTKVVTVRFEGRELNYA